MATLDSSPWRHAVQQSGPPRGMLAIPRGSLAIPRGSLAIPRGSLVSLGDHQISLGDHQISPGDQQSLSGTIRYPSNSKVGSFFYAREESIQLKRMTYNTALAFNDSK